MRAVLDAARLRSALVAATSAVSEAPGPLASVLLRVQGSTLTVVGGDMITFYVGTRVVVDAKPGAVLVRGDVLEAFVGRLKGDVTLDVQKGLLSVSAKGAREATFPVGEADTYVEIPDTKGERFVVPGEVLARLVRHTSHAQSKDTTRPHLAATLMRFEPGTLTAVATNSFWLARSVAEVATVCPQKRLDVLVPGRSIDRMTLDANDITIQLSPHRWISFDDLTTGDRWISATVDAAYPSFEQVIPRDAACTCEQRINRAAFLDVLATCASVGGAAEQSTTGGAFMSREGADVMRVTRDAREAGRVTDTVPVECVRGELVQVGIVTASLITSLRALSADTVTLLTCGELDPIVIHGEPGTTTVLMPLRGSL